MLRQYTFVNYLAKTFFIISTLIAFDSPLSSVVRTDYGFIDYANRIIVSRGTADIISRELSEADLQVVGKNIKLSKAEARARARENLLDLVKLVNFDGRTVREIMNSDGLTESRVESLVGSAFQQGEKSCT